MADHYTKKQYPKTTPALLKDPLIFGQLVKREVKDVHPISIGKATIPPSFQAYTNCINSVHLFFSIKGSGSFELEGTWYHIKEQEFFVLPIGTVTYLCASENASWTYRWISFSGTLSHDFMTFPTVFSLPKDFTDTLYDPKEDERNLSSQLAGDLFRIHARLYNPDDTSSDYVQSVINRINISYMQKLTVTNLAKELGLDRSHLSRVFKARMDVTIQEYLLHFRITKSKQYLLNGYSVTDTAQLCGFGERINFSRAFLKEAGFRPTDWLKIQKNYGLNKPR